MKTITLNCAFCELPFERATNEANRSRRQGRKQYCSPACSGKARSAEPRIQHEPNVICALCQTPFYKKSSDLINSVHGIYFCCRAHKDKAQRIGGIKEIMPPHYGTGNGIDSKTYRKVARKHHPQVCVGCGYDNIPEILHVHHKDGHRSNIDPSNLEWRCGRCHDEWHYLTHTGKWS